LCIALVLSLPAAAHADSLTEIFERANAAYFRGDHDAAARDYEQLLAAGVVDADVSYNLGATEAKRGRYGAAVLHFERALWLRPGDDDARRGLDEVRAALGRRRAAARGEAEVDAGPPFGEALFGSVSPDLLTVLALFFNLVFFGSIVVLLFARRESVRLGLGIAAVVSGVLLALTGTGLAVRSGWLDDGEPAVVLRERAVLREGPDGRAGERGHAPEGERAYILDREREWARVRVGSLGEGWMAAEDVAAVRMTR
jgi:tetratricopeptide (TPR) repeat protein